MEKENYEQQVFISKIKDKINFCKTKNKIQFTDFLDMNQKSIAINVLRNEKFNNYIVNNNQDEFERNLIVMYPDKLDENIAKKHYEQIVSIIKIENNINMEYEHRVYLSGIMKLGIQREKFGDIIVNKNGANIIIFKELSEYVSQELKTLIRFKKSDISILNITKLEKNKIEFENIKVIVSSTRLDNVVSEIGKISRSKAKEYIEDGKVFVNSICELKASKEVKEGNTITIRGKGKFIFENIERKTKNNHFVLNIKKYIN